MIIPERDVLDCLAAAGDCRLPVFVHGGLTPELPDPAAAAFGRLSNLAKVDWGVTTAPVVIGHAGLAGHSAAEIRSEALPRLRKLLSRHEHLWVDVAGLEGGLLPVLKSVDHGRILFGSGAFYIPVWGAVVRVFQALRRTTSRGEEAFLRIAALNPARVFMDPAS